MLESIHLKNVDPDPEMKMDLAEPRSLEGKRAVSNAKALMERGQASTEEALRVDATLRCAL